MADDKTTTQTVYDPLAMEVQDQYMASYVEKDSLGLHEKWARYEDYWVGNQNPKKSSVTNHPGSVTNIILPTIESSIADVVMEPLEITVGGWTMTDKARAPRAQLAAQWTWEKNKMTLKRDRFERQKKKFGTGVWKVFFDGQNGGTLGMPVIEPVNPANFFPDPKVRSYEALNHADYIIHAIPRSRKYLKRVYGAKADELMANPNPTHDPQIFESKSAFERIARDKVLVLERWTLESGEDGLKLRKVVVADTVVLYDSDKDTEERQKRGFYPLNRYPFIVVPNYHREGMLWGLSDVEILEPIQNLINELDDQIRMNARLMGNIQKVISIGSGINPNMWTNDPGLNIPARDINGWKIVEPPNMPAYIYNRRTEARDVEAQLISGRTDAMEGRRPGSVRAASAIIALQEAGLRRVNHQKLLSQQGLSDVFSIVMDYLSEYWTEEVEIGEEIMNEAGDSKPIMWSGKEIKEVPILQESGQPLLDSQGQPMTRRASFDITVNIGAGFVNSKSYIYQATLELVQYGVITREEARAVLKEILDWPIIDPWNPQGEFAGQAQSGAMVGAPQEAQSVLPQEMAPTGMEGGAIPPEIMNQLVLAMGGGNMAGGM